MDNALQQLVNTVNDYVSNLIDVADMPEDDRQLLKTHLLAVEDILLKNGNVKLQEVINAMTQAILNRL